MYLCIDFEMLSFILVFSNVGPHDHWGIHCSYPLPKFCRVLKERFENHAVKSEGT